MKSPLLSTFLASSLLLACLLPRAAEAAPERALEDPPPSSAVQFMEAKMLAAEGSWAEASSAFERAAAGAQVEPYVHIEYARLLLRLSQFLRPDLRTARVAEAASEAEAALRASPGNLDALRVLVEVRVEQASGDPAAIGLARQTLAALLAKSPGDLQAGLTAAQLALAASDPQDALRVLDEARVSRPRNEALTAAILETLRGIDGGVALERELVARLAKDPPVLEWRLAAIDLRLDRLDVDGAQELLAAAPVEQQEEVEWLRRQSVVRFRDADPEGALASLDVLEGRSEPAFLAVAGGPRERLEDRFEDDARIRRVALLLALPDYPAAEAAARRVLANLDSAPEGGGEGLSAIRGHLNALLLRALLGQGRREEASAWAISASAAEAGAGPMAGLRLAITAASMGEWDLVLRMVDPWVSRPADADRASGREHALGLAALARLRKAEPLEAARLLQGQTTPELVGRRAEALWRGGDRRAAKELLAELGRGDRDLQLTAAEVWQRLDRYRESAAAARAVLATAAVPAGDSTGARFLLATSLERSGREAEAVGELERLLVDDPTFAPALNYLGYLFADSGRELDRALWLTRAAVAADPANAAYLDSLAWTRFRRGEFALAARLLERAARLESGDGTLWEHLGDARAALGDRLGAAMAYRKALASVEAAPESPSAVRRKLRGVEKRRGN